MGQLAFLVGGNDTQHPDKIAGGERQCSNDGGSFLPYGPDMPQKQTQGHTVERYGVAPETRPLASKILHLYPLC